MDKFTVGEVTDREAERFGRLLLILTGIWFWKSSNEPRYFSRHRWTLLPVSLITNRNHILFHSIRPRGPVLIAMDLVRYRIDENKLIPDRNTGIRKGGIKPLGKYRNVWIFWQIEAITEKNGFTLDTPIRDINEEALNKILYGSDEVLRLSNTPLGMNTNYFLTFEGVVNFIGNMENGEEKKNGTKIKDQYVHYEICPECKEAD